MIQSFMEQKEQYYPLTWEHYGILLDDLWPDLKTKLEKHNTKVDALCVILREGGFVGLPLAYRLNTYKVLTVQYKYLLSEGSNELVFVSDIPTTTYELPEAPVILLCDTFPCGGETKFLAVEKLKAKFPKAKFIFASLIQDVSVDSHPDFLFSAYGFDVNEKWETTHPLFKKLGIVNALNVFLPWENEQEEYASVEQKEWKYN